MPGVSVATHRNFGVASVMCDRVHSGTARRQGSQRDGPVSAAVRGPARDTSRALRVPSVG